MKKTILLSILFIVITLSFLFYWFEVRPTKIRHDCSWRMEIEKGSPARPAMTEKELEYNGLFEKESLSDCSEGNDDSIGYFANACKSLRRRMIQEYSKPQPAIPDKKVWKRTSNEYYKFCLRDKGIRY